MTGWLSHPIFGTLCWPIFTLAVLYHHGDEMLTIPLALFGAFMAGVSVQRLLQS